MKELTVTLINGAKFSLPTKCIHKKTHTTRLDLAGGSKLFANWYILSVV